MVSREKFLEILKDYKEKCNLLKQINSDKMDFYSRLDNAINVLTIIASLILTAIGFANKEIVIKFLSTPNKPIEPSTYEFFFNLCVLFFLIISIINLIFNFREKAFLHYRAIISLSALIRDINDAKFRCENSDSNDMRESLNLLMTKYGYIVDSLPLHSDSDYLSAKKALYKKNLKAKKIEEGHDK